MFKAESMSNNKRPKGNLLAMFQNISVVLRVSLGFAILVVLMLIISGVSLLGMTGLNSQLLKVTNEAVPLVEEANKASIALLTANRHFKDFITSKDSAAMDAAELAFSTSETQFKEQLAGLTSLTKNQNDINNLLEQLGSLDESFFGEAKAAMASYRSIQASKKDVSSQVADFYIMLPQLKKFIADKVQKLQDDYIRNLADEYYVALNGLEGPTVKALSSDQLSDIDNTISQNEKRRGNYESKLVDLEDEIPDLRNDVGFMLDRLDKALTAPDGALANHRQLIFLTDDVFNKASAAAQSIADAVSVFDQVTSAATTFVNTASDDASSALNKGLSLVAILGLLSILIAAVIGWSTAIGIRRPLKNILDVLSAIVDGDMTHTVTVKGENEFGQLGSWVNKLNQQMRDILGQLTTASHHLSQVAVSNQQTSTHSRDELDRQRHETASVATAMTEMSASVKEVTYSANITLEKVLEVESAANTGREVMSHNITTTHQLSEKLKQSNEVIGQVDGYSNNIGGILVVIRGIADQTNLLALNAAIEAARAGEQGRGFAVVADEVRNLAQKTGESITEIQSMIESLQSSAKQAVEVVSECFNEMEASVMQASDANSSMEEIQGIIAQISDMSSQIAAAAEEQQCTADEITRNINHISDISDENYEGIEAIAKGSAELERLAKEQDQLVDRFKL
ncbi:methyl-accepting chemotaxis protein [Corallincola luteus]|uniref:Methyl-accepting chemotaxis protein n=3 Tax=Psychromonadaceae TaxID=267894 RepID=A0ABY1WTH3_9GAMM|nr:methyl-accepting chemotaxis protein [Corallincola spongiicola]TCI03302.1 methyl-accepting chemotaxis protein [Corallincola luteus]